MTVKTDMNLTITSLGIGCSDYITIDKRTATSIYRNQGGQRVFSRYAMAF
jgi:hypothetical protein